MKVLIETNNTRVLCALYGKNSEGKLGICEVENINCEIISAPIIYDYQIVHMKYYDVESMSELLQKYPEDLI